MEQKPLGKVLNLTLGRHFNKLTDLIYISLGQHCVFPIGDLYYLSFFILQENKSRGGIVLTSWPGTEIEWDFRTGATMATESPIFTPHPLAQLYTVTPTHPPSRSTMHRENGIPDSGITVQITLPRIICGREDRSLKCTVYGSLEYIN